VFSKFLGIYFVLITQMTKLALKAGLAFKASFCYNKKTQIIYILYKKVKLNVFNTRNRKGVIAVISRKMMRKEFLILSYNT